VTDRERALVSAGGAALGVTVAPDALARIGGFVDLLDVWNRRFRLTGTRRREEIVARHVVDSLAPIPYLPDAGVVIDVGSGAGFPGIIFGCVRPALHVILVESRRRPATFLREVARAVSLPRVEVLETRAEDAARGGLEGRATAVVGRAVRLDVFLALARPLLASDGSAIAMQTPRTARGAEAAVAACGLRLTAVRSYMVPGGGERCLIFASSAL